MTPRLHRFTDAELETMHGELGRELERRRATPEGSSARARANLQDAYGELEQAVRAELEKGLEATVKLARRLGVSP